MHRRHLMAIGLFIVGLASVTFANTAFAAQPQSNAADNGNGLRISPVRNELTIKPGSSQSADVYVQNITSKPTELKAIINDFVASENESGEPRILLDPNTSAPSHGLKQYIAKINNFTLQPQEQRVIKVTVNIPANAAGGGYYGAVRFAPAETDSSKNVSLSASVGSLFLVTVPGNIQEQLGLAGFNVTKGDDGKASNFFTNGNGLQVNLRFKNTGNVQEAPFGKAILKKSGKQIAEYEVNDTAPRGNVLPDSIRKFNVKIDKSLGFGKYTVEGNFGYGNTGQLVSANTSFWVVPMPYIIAIIVLILIILGAIFVFPRMMKQHDRKLLKRVRSKGKK